MTYPGPLALEDLADLPGFAFISSPFTSYWLGMTCAATDAQRATAALIQRGIRCYCPVAHGYAVARSGRMDPTDAHLWMSNDRPIFDAASWLIVVRLKGWDHSIGVGEEIDRAREAGKPVIFVDPEELGL